MKTVTHKQPQFNIKALPDCVSVEHIGTGPLELRGTRNRLQGCQAHSDTLDPVGGPFLSHAPYLATRDELLQVPLPGPLNFSDPREVPRGESGPVPLYSIQENNRTEKQKSAKDKTKSKAEIRAFTQDGLISAMEVALRTGKLAGYDLNELHFDGKGIIEGWRKRIDGCGDQLWLKACPDGHSAKAQMQCCHVPVCVWETRRKALEWRSRGNALMQFLSDGVTFGVAVKLLRAHDVDIPRMDYKPRNTARMGWKMVTVSLRGNGHLARDTEATLTYRTQLARWLRNRGSLAIVGALDVGQDGHPHLHLLVYSPFIPRDQLQHWQKARDCTVAGCEHPADDRCDACKAAGIDCVHPHSDGRPRCNGSWVVDVRAAWSPDEVLKYSVSPKTEPELHLAVYVLTYRRHRVETYGAARVGAWKELDKASRVEEGHCPVCGQELELVSVGTRQRGTSYVWHPPPSNTRFVPSNPNTPPS